MGSRLLPLFVGFLVGALMITPSFSSLAQTSPGTWSTPVMLYEGKGTVSEPALAPDQTGMLHAFWTYVEEGAPPTIFYARWDGTEWTQPVDVIAMPGGIQGPRAVVDRYGTIQLIWRGPNNILFHSSADAVDADAASGWTSPVSLTQSNPHADIAIDDAGTLHVVYPALIEGGIYHIASVDGGENWTQPVLVANPVRATATTDFARLAVAPNGNLHAVWTELVLPDGWPPLGAYYARSTDGGLTWSEPVEMAADGYLEANIAAVDQNVIHIAWNGMSSISGRYRRWSSDGGNTWSPVRELASPELHGGSTNPPALSVDSSGTVHAAINTQPGSVAGTDATMYIFGRDDSWSTPLDISHQAPGYVGSTNEASALAIVGGNRLNVLFVDNDGTRIWHTSKTSAAPPGAASDFLPNPRSSSAPTAQTPSAKDTAPTDEMMPTPASTRSAVSASAALPMENTSASQGVALLIGILPALIVVGGVVLFVLSRRHMR